MKTYWKITLTYLIFGISWILITDLIAFGFSPDNKMFALVEVLKGWFYVFLSAAVIFYLTRNAFFKQAAAHEEKFAIYQNTIRGVHHIFLNYLNQMQLMTLEAERFPDFDSEALELSKSASAEAAEELMKLGEIEKISPENIESFVFRKMEQKPENVP
ncbi:hypothetical protein [Luteolibacter pohnpeiensis]|nr:hypothetical protein [Luteolibacter pohnpeiensis]